MAYGSPGCEKSHFSRRSSHVERGFNLGAIWGTWKWENHWNFSATQFAESMKIWWIWWLGIRKETLVPSLPSPFQCTRTHFWVSSVWKNSFHKDRRNGSRITMRCHVACRRGAENQLVPEMFRLNRKEMMVSRNKQPLRLRILPAIGRPPFISGTNWGTAMWPLKKVAGAAKSMAAQRRLLGMLQSSQSHSFASFLNSAIIFWLLILGQSQIGVAEHDQISDFVIQRNKWMISSWMVKTLKRGSKKSMVEYSCIP